MPDTQAALQRALCDEIRRRYPDFTGSVGAPLGQTPDGRNGVRILGPMDPCELCGTRIVPLQRPRGDLWYSLDRAFLDSKTGQWRAFWTEHSRDRCRSARTRRQGASHE